MALGIDTTAGSGGDFLPIIKYDARAGRVFRVDRSNNGGGWVTENVDITQNFSAVMDLANIETGWINFPVGGAPDIQVSAIDAPKPPAPTDKHKMGYRVMVKLSKDSGGDVREFCSVAKTAVGGLSNLHDEYLKGAKGNPGMLPVVALTGTLAVTSEGGGQKTTNYAPQWRIERWVNRPSDLVFKPRNAAAVNAAPAQAPRTPPSTGSTKAQAPQQRATATANAEDFG